MWTMIAAWDFTAIVLVVLIVIALLWGIDKLRNRKRPDYTKSSRKHGRGGSGDSGKGDRPSLD